MVKKLPVAAVLVIALVSLVFTTRPASATSSSLIISEIQTGGCAEYDVSDPAKCAVEDGKREFIELYNPLETPVDVSGWAVQYLSASHTGAPELEPTRLISGLSGSVAADGYALLSYVDYLEDADIYFGANSTLSSGLLSKSGGHVRIVDQLGHVVDQVGWGSAKIIASWPRTSVIPVDFSIKRVLPDDPLFSTGLTFTPPTQPLTPQGGSLDVPDLTPPEEPNPDPEPEPQPACQGIILSELLPNAAGVDDGKEFIEIHNPTGEAQALLGCAFRLNSDGTEFELPDEILPPGAYRAFYDSETGIGLPNAAGGSLWLLLTASEQEARYPQNMADDHTWAYIDGQWKVTSKPTPGAANELPQVPPAPVPSQNSGGDTELKPCAANQERNPATNRCRLIPVAETLQPCQSGQERNPATNRCRAILSANTALAPCAANQERNPDTNRCRAVVTAASTLTACKPGQERNPATNRCRSAAAAESALKPCAPNQERNPATNRCRLATSAASTLGLTDVKDVASESSAAGNFRWWLAALAALGATGYGAYEWRREIANAVGRLKARFGSTAASK